MQFFETLKSFFGIPTKAEIAAAATLAEAKAFETLTPEVVVNIPGFRMTAEKKEGVLLTSRPKDDPEAEGKPASEDSYYEVIITSTGNNAEYPEPDKEYKARFTTALSQAAGFVGGANFVSVGHKPFKFELAEDFFDATKPYMGRATVSHHTLTLTAHFRNAEGEITKTSMGYAVRKSDKPVVEAMRGCPVNYF